MPLSEGNAVTVLHIMTSSKVTLPAMHLQLVDALQIMPQFNLSDGSSVTVVIEGQVKVERKFRVHSWYRTQFGLGFSYTLDCYYDSPKYWATTSVAGIQGSSHDAIKQIADKCGLQFWDQNTNTNDNMLWMPTNKPYGAFARDIARYGYINDKSHMVLAVDTTGVVRYKNVNAESNPEITVGYVNTNNEENFVTMVDFRAITQSGTNNIIGGYLHDRYVQSIAKDGNLESELSVVSKSEVPLMNSEVRDQISQGTVSFSPIDAGNVHPKYERAKYQNTRYNLLKSMQVEFLFPLQTSFEPTDSFKYVAPVTQHNEEYNGEYFVMAKVIFVTGTSYQEKIVAVRNGLNK